MKKLIVILFLFPLITNAQLAKDKYYHAGAGVVISEGTFLLSQKLWQDNKLSCRMAVSLTAYSAFGKEMFDAFSGGRFNWNDAVFTFTSGLITAYINKWLFKPRKKQPNNIILEFPLIGIN